MLFRFFLNNAIVKLAIINRVLPLGYINGSNLPASHSPSPPLSQTLCIKGNSSCQVNI